MSTDTKFKARTFWKAESDVVDANAELKRYDLLKREATVDLNLYTVAIAYLMYPWYAEHACAADRSGHPSAIALERVVKLVRIAMQNPAMIPDSRFRKFAFFGHLVPGDKRVALVLVDHDTAQEIVSFIVEHVGTTPGPLPQNEHDTLIQLAQTHYQASQAANARAPEAPPSLDLVMKAKSMLCLIDDLDVEVPQRSVEQLKALASGKPTTSSGTKESYSPVWVHPEFKLAKNIGKPPFNIVVLSTPDNSKDETDVEK